MSIEKTSSVVLSIFAYRESSFLMHLFTREHGRVHALAKGVRKYDRRGVPLERGYLIEHLTYLKPHRELHQITDCHIREHYPAIRGNLEKTAVRDVLFEVVLGAIKVTDPHPELFDYLVYFLSELDGQSSRGNELLVLLSKTLFSVADHLGFCIDFGKCGTCGKMFGESVTAWLTVNKGLLQCSDCAPRPGNTGGMLPGNAAAYFACPEESVRNHQPKLTDRESVGVLRIACEYCRYHLDIRRRLESLTFVEYLYARDPDASG